MPLGWPWNEDKCQHFTTEMWTPAVRLVACSRKSSTCLPLGVLGLRLSSDLICCRGAAAVAPALMGQGVLSPVW